MIEAEVEIEIPFHDIDVMGVAWHGHYVKYLELARCALLDKIDYNYLQMKASGFAWPVIDIRIRYPRPLVFQQKIRVSACIVDWENRLKINYLIADSETGQRLTRAYTVQVAFDLENNEMLYVTPDVLLQKLGIDS